VNASGHPGPPPHESVRTSPDVHRGLWREAAAPEGVGGLPPVSGKGGVGEQPPGPPPPAHVRNVSVKVTFPLAGTVPTRFPPLSHVTFPPPSLRRYLYSNTVPAGRETSSFQTG
jgi:hypothetical protein